MMEKRGIQYFTLSEIEPRIWFMLTGCNFRCRGCFRPARDGGGVPLTAEETIERAKRACMKCYGFLPKKAMITGGEPTISREYLLSLVSGLKSLGFNEIVLMTNGYAIGAQDGYASELKDAGVTEIHLDIKAFSDEIHRWYTGKSNKYVLKAARDIYDAGIDLLIQTIYIPNIVGADEIEKIAAFIASIDENIRYRINPFAPTFAFERVSRIPTIEEMEEAYEVAKRYLKNVIISRSCYREYPTPPPQRTWITVYPDLTVKRRSMRDQNEERMRWLRRPREQVIRDFEREVGWDYTLRERILTASSASTASSSASSALSSLKNASDVCVDTGSSVARGDSVSAFVVSDAKGVRVRFSSALLPVTKQREVHLALDGHDAQDSQDAQNAQDAKSTASGVSGEPQMTLFEVLKKLAERYGEQFKRRVFDGEKVNEFVNISVNGLLVDRLDVPVKEGDEIIILSVISGG